MAPPRKQAENRENKHFPVALEGSCLLEKGEVGSANATFDECMRDKVGMEKSESNFATSKADGVGLQNKIGQDSVLNSEFRIPTSDFKGVPIIAMTAHAMAGDEQKSIEAGMNDHVTKPIDPDKLFSTLQRWIQPREKRARVNPSEAPAEQTEPDTAVPAEDDLPESLSGFDLADGLKRLQGNKRLYRKLLLSFGSEYDSVANEIRQALDAGDFDQAHSLVHNLKGLAGNLAATDLQVAAVNLEEMVKGIDPNAPSPEQLNSRFAELENTLGEALSSAQSLGVSAEENICDFSDEAIAAIPSDLAQGVAKRIRDAAEMGDVMTLNAIAEEIKDQSDSCIPLSRQINQMAEDFDLDGIQKLADELDK